MYRVVFIFILKRTHRFRVALVLLEQFEAPHPNISLEDCLCLYLKIC